MNPLQEYAKKRNFKKTHEPAPSKKTAGKAKAPIFVVQEHHASHLHYDFRLEMDGVLKSWAVPKGPSMVPGEKRLAIEVEDHPLSYASFTGKIPKGEYGGGEVFIWDRGSWEPPKDAASALRNGHLEFSLKGSKLSGSWLLIRTQRSSGKKNQWLLIKRSEPGKHAMTGIPLERSLAKTTEKTPVKRKPQEPEFIMPQLALLVDKPPEGSSWIHETKFDGYRIQAHLDRKGLRLLTRSGQDWTAKYPPINEALKKLKTQKTILDGEIVALDSQGRSNFQLLQNALKAKNTKNLVFYVFDLLVLNGKDLRERPLLERKEKLQQLIDPLNNKHLQYVDGIEGSGKLLLQSACKNGLEGIISKTKHSPYISGRLDTWLKSKCKKRQEFVIGGYTDPQGAREGFGALLLGVYTAGKLQYVGKVGTGFNKSIISKLLPKLKKNALDKSPFQEKSPRASGVHWVKPELVAEINFADWTEDKILRVPVYHGLREDKPATEIHIESPAQTKLTHPDKILFEKEKLTKSDVANYYQKTAEFILPHLQERPLSLLRCPSGTTEGCFFQKNYQEKDSDVLHCIRVREKTKTACYLAADSPEAMMALVQMGTIEIHPWNSRQADLEKPDQIVMDFDPGPSVPWQRVVQSALELKQILEKIDIESFVKVTGGKGIHVHIPIDPVYTWDQVHEFTKSLATQMAKENPTLFVTDMSKKLRKNKIFIDYLRNSRGATAVAPYSLRAKPKSAVALPLTWKELQRVSGADAFTMELALKKIAQRKKDPWAQYFTTSQRISEIRI